jgi:hypothetical protein
MKLAIAQVYDGSYGSGVFLGNLNLGQGESGISTGSTNPLPDELNALGKLSLYEGCEQEFQVDFDLQFVTQAIKIIPMGAAVDNLLAPDGEPLNLLDTLNSGETTVKRKFIVKQNPSFSNGEKGYIISISTIAGTTNEVARDTTEIYDFYRQVTHSAQYVMPTTMYPGKLELNLSGGSPNLFRSFTGGATWENAWLPVQSYQISAIGSEGTILLCEPNGCVTYTVNVGRTEYPPAIPREINIPQIPGAEIYPPAGRLFVNSRENYTFTIVPTATGGSIPVVTTNRTRIPDSEGVAVTPNADGSYTVTIYNIMETVQLYVDFATSSESLAGDRVWSNGDRLYVASHRAGEAKIYSVAGKLVKTVVLSTGEAASLPLPAGIYMIALNGKTYRVAVR